MSVIVAMKFNEELYVKNSYFLKAAIRNCYIYSIDELNQLESSFLEAIDYRLLVKPDELDRYFNLIQRKSLELQCKQFKIVQPKYELVENYFYPEHSDIKGGNETKSYQSPRIPPVFLNDRLFRDEDEVYSFFQCDELCENSTRLSHDSSFTSDSDGSPRFQ